jgi:hypothetical protein
MKVRPAMRGASDSLHVTVFSFSGMDPGFLPGSVPVAARERV